MGTAEYASSGAMDNAIMTTVCRRETDLGTASKCPCVKVRAVNASTPGLSKTSARWPGLQFGSKRLDYIENNLNQNHLLQLMCNF